MPEWLNEPGEIAAIVTIFAAVMSALLWIIRKEVVTQKKQFMPNHGNSLRDVVNRIESSQKTVLDELSDIRNHQYEQQERLFNSVGKVHARIDEHIRDHLTEDKREKK